VCHDFVVEFAEKGTPGVGPFAGADARADDLVVYTKLEFLVEKPGVWIDMLQRHLRHPKP
jgi:hypothetical protein